MPHVECLPDGSEASLRAALAVCVLDLADLPLRISPRTRHPDPLWWSGSAVIDDRFVVKYAWSDVRAERLWREGVLLERLRAADPMLCVLEPVVVSRAPGVGLPGGGNAATWVDDLGRRLDALEL